ncbi:cupredoxin domain-containing protein [Alicyclobacillus fastidiosus]|uniref:Cupredoxin domain-containing protein n=1 Tax=Alicyclobacillus fastidiosus TaxID=392011 RepID=A0ABY6ZM87_9BACL|nr:cupredoxin domain-containing protein [Alicyclobacillus fastidiosus]WAH43999.1 cupredoxin domain-containing protein [Alicyclobacillus fastidiosus]GMA60277.1 hypothetical protein GCM10025859_07170 [Alicyclobacillus fastidiosus]
MSRSKISVQVACAIGASLVFALVALPSPVEAKDQNVTVVITDHGFSPNKLTELLHHPVHLHIENKGKELHEFAIPEYRIYTRTLGPGETSDVEFSPWQAGSFVMYSDPKADSHPEFEGRFIVTDK